jgi:hypothetical protein
MRRLIAGLVFGFALLQAAPGWSATNEEELKALRTKLSVLEGVIDEFEAKWNVISQDIDDSNTFVIGGGFDRVRKSEIEAAANMAVKVLGQHPELEPELRKAYPKEFGLLDQYGVEVENFANPFLASVARVALEQLLKSELPKIESNHAAALRKEHDAALKFLQDQKRELTDKIAALEQEETAGTGDASTTPPAGEAGKPAPGSQPFDTAALGGIAWAGTWEAQCAGGDEAAETKSGPAEFQFAGNTATITLKGEGDPMPFPVTLDPLGAFSMQQGEEGGEVRVNGQFQNYDFGDGSYAPMGKGTFYFSLDLSFLADALASAFTFGAAGGADLTPEQREANTLRCNGTWELPLPG